LKIFGISEEIIKKDGPSNQTYNDDFEFYYNEFQKNFFRYNSGKARAEGKRRNNLSDCLVN